MSHVAWNKADVWSCERTPVWAQEVSAHAVLVLTAVWVEAELGQWCKQLWPVVAVLGDDVATLTVCSETRDLLLFLHHHHPDSYTHSQSEPADSHQRWNRVSGSIRVTGHYYYYYLHSYKKYKHWKTINTTINNTDFNYVQKKNQVQKEKKKEKWENYSHSLPGSGLGSVSLTRFYLWLTLHVYHMQSSQSSLCLPPPHHHRLVWLIR